MIFIHFMFREFPKLKKKANEDITLSVGEVSLLNKLNQNMNKNINWHDLRMRIGLIIMFVIGGLQVIHSYVPFAATIDSVLPILLLIEHFLLGNTSDTPTI